MELKRKSALMVRLKEKAHILLCIDFFRHKTTHVSYGQLKKFKKYVTTFN